MEISVLYYKKNNLSKMPEHGAREPNSRTPMCKLTTPNIQYISKQYVNFLSAAL
jgi:hypothetical protein